MGTKSNSLPKTPQEWRDYADSDGFDRLPNQTFVTPNHDATDKFTERGICINLGTSQAIKSRALRVWIIADVLIVDSNVNITTQPFQSIFIYARRITSEAPSTINLLFSQNKRSQVHIYCAQVDQKLSYLCPGLASPVSMSLGEPSTAGIIFDAQANTIPEPQYRTLFPLLDLSPANFSELIRTQLRIATVLYWTNPDLAIDICSWVAKATEDQEESRRLHVQANAMGQQILAEKTTQHGATYLPVLAADAYRKALKDAISIAQKYQKGYEDISWRGEDLKNQQAGWDVMLSQAASNLEQQTFAAEGAYQRWENSNRVWSEARQTFSLRVISLEARASELKAGIEQYKVKKGAELFIALLSTVIAIGSAVGGIIVGMPQGAGGAGSAAADAAKAAEAAAKAQKEGWSSLLKTTELLSKAMDAATKLVPVVKAAEKDPRAKLKLDSKYLSPDLSAVQGDDGTVLASVAAWDQWILETDSQMSFAVNQGIDGAAKYQLQLRLHAIDGKLAAQAQAMAIKTSGEYFLAVMGLNAATEAVSRLKGMRDRFTGQADALLDAQTAYYDRLQESRTNILVRMRTMQLAQRYETLKDSSIRLDPLKEDISKYEQDVSDIAHELEQYKSGSVDDPRTFTYKRKASELAPEYGQGFHAAILQSLKTAVSTPPTSLSEENQVWATKVLTGAQHRTSFTISPLPIKADGKTTDAANVHATSVPTIMGPFKGAYHVRLYGLRVFLIGVVPSQAALSSGQALFVSLQIRTSGIYNDVDENGNVLTFSTRPMSRKFQYRIDKDGKIDSDYEVDSVVMNQEHINPTPFAQWSVQINNPEDLDLSGLKDVEFHWPGEAYSK